MVQFDVIDKTWVCPVASSSFENFRFVKSNFEFKTVQLVSQLKNNSL